ncbi:MAG: metallophosphoesterase, partial [Negativicutes bacterium]
MHSSPKYWFFAILILLDLGIAWLVLFFLKKQFPYYRSKNVVYAYWLITVGSLIIVTLGRFSPSAALTAALMKVAIVWLIGQITALIAMPLIYAIVRFAKDDEQQTDDKESNNITRRNFLRGMVAALPLSTLGLTGYGVFSGGSKIVLQHHSLTLPQLPKSLSGYKIAQLSDTHIGLYFSLEKLDSVLKTILAEKPDMLVITGDLIDEVALAERTFERLSAIAPQIPDGIYFSWGNHEYFRDINRIRRALENSRVVLLENRAIKIADGDTPFYLAGVDYPWAKNAEMQVSERGRMIGQTMADVPHGAFTILLSHHPDFIINAFD